MIQRIRVRLSRLGPAAQRTHLQQIETVRRALRNAGWIVKKISFGPAISVGVESLAEYCDVQLSARMDLGKAKDDLAQHMTDGYGVLEVKSIPRFFPSLEESVNLCQVEVSSPLLRDSRAAWERFWAATEFVVVKKKADREVAIEARSLVRSWSLEDETLILFLRFGPGRTLKPERLVQAVCGLPDEACAVGTPTGRLQVKRLEFYLEKDNGELLSI